MNSTLISKLILQTGNFNNNIGLMQGSIGYCILFYHVARNKKLNEFELKADELLDKAFSNITKSSPLDFENGLAGIGWGIEYLVLNGFAQGDTDEILEDIDDKIFKAILEEGPQSLELTNGLTGYLYYLIYRLKNKTNTSTNAYKVNRELLIELINRLDVMLTSQFPAIVKDIHFDLFWKYPVILTGLFESYKLNIHNEKIERIFTQWIPYFEAYIPSLHINRIYWALTLQFINRVICSKELEKHIRVLLFAVDYENLKCEIDPNRLSLRFGSPGATWLLYMAKTNLPANTPNYESICRFYEELLLNNNKSLELLQKSPLTSGIKPGLSDGLAGVCLLDILYPGVIINN